ncbi:unnamed protein product [Ectocarpus sp. 12 AP-2014]
MLVSTHTACDDNYELWNSFSLVTHRYSVNRSGHPMHRDFQLDHVYIYIPGDMTNVGMSRDDFSKPGRHENRCFFLRRVNRSLFFSLRHLIEIWPRPKINEFDSLENTLPISVLRQLSIG